MSAMPPTPDPPDTIDSASTKLADDLCIHIFTVSAGMVGVCLTVIGLIRIIITIRKVDTFADDLLAVNAVLFLVACLTAYTALRTRDRKRMSRLEHAADAVFLLAMVVMVFACLFITFSIAAL